MMENDTKSRINDVNEQNIPSSKQNYFNVSAWCIRNPIPAILLFVLLTIFGLHAFSVMKVQNFPDIDLPMITVSAALPGGSPEQLESEVVRKIENSLASLQGLKHIFTVIQDGISVTSAQFVLEKSTQEALDDVRSAVAGLRAALPIELNDPVVNKVNLTGLPILTYTVASSRMTEEELSWFVDNEVTRAIMSARGVGAVARIGGVDRQISVALDPTKLLGLNITASDVSRRLKQIQQQNSGGRGEQGDQEQSVRMIATVPDVLDLASTSIVLSDGRHVRLDQIAEISDSVSERRSAALLDGKPVVGFEISRSIGSGEIEVFDRVLAVLQELQKKHPDIKIDEAFNFVTPIMEKYQSSMGMLYEGALLAVIVVWLFLKDIRATIVSAVALPLSIIPAFGGMYLLGFTNNVITLLALSLVVGILVDDAIVEVENITRHMHMGKSPYQASVDAADEIGLAVIATTFTLISVFLPTAFMGGIPGKFFVQFGWTAAIAVFTSLVVARMLTPMMSAYFLRRGLVEPTEGAVTRYYMKSAAWCLEHRFKTIGLTGIFFLVSIFLAGSLKADFLPDEDLSETQVRLELPPGSTLQNSLDISEAARRIISSNPSVHLVYTTIGSGKIGGDPLGLASAGEVRRATLTINLVPRKERKGIRKQNVEAQLREALKVLPGVHVSIGLAGASKPYKLVLSSENGDLLLSHAETVMKELRSLPNVGNISSSVSLLQPELVIRPDFDRASDLGVTASDIAETVRIATVGDYMQNLAKLNLAERQIPILVRLSADARKDPGLLSQLRIPGTTGHVMLSAIASITHESGPAEISRYDRYRNVDFKVELGSLALGEVQKMVLDLPSIKHLPPGILAGSVGDAEAMGELMASFGIAMLTGILCIYVVLVLLFKDFFQPFTILGSLVLSVPGAFLALWIGNKSISMPSMIGLIMLMGVATKNSILLVEYAISSRAMGCGRRDALLDACHKRARPIVMTTVAMAAGMAPAILGLGDGDTSFRAPMAIVVVGGLITSTFLSLLVIPVVFTLIDDVVVFFRNRLWGSSN